MSGGGLQNPSEALGRQLAVMTAAAEFFAARSKDLRDWRQGQPDDGDVAAAEVVADWAREIIRRAGECGFIDEHYWPGGDL